jgi:hypothetical protein
MNHPVIYRVVFYGIMAGLCGSILFLLNLMVEAPFSSKNMRNAYYDGCNIGLHSPLTTESVARCESIANMYKETLDNLDRQMNP